MATGIQTRKGAIKLWRLGNLAYGDQARWSKRAPTSRGLWAFPWPYFDPFFTNHQYTYILPKRFRVNNAHMPLQAEWYEFANGEQATTVTFDPQGYPVESVQVKDDFHEQQWAWIASTGRKVLPLRKFWYEGYLYSHMRPNGEIGSTGLFDDAPDWYRIHSSEFAEAIRKTNGNLLWDRMGGELAQVKSSIDHMEVFLAPQDGRIFGREEKCK